MNMQRDTQIFDIISEELGRQRRGLELIASENFTSMQVMQAMGNVMTNKYAEGYPGRRYYGGCEHVDESENLAINRAKEIFGVEYVNVQPHSGAQANTAVQFAVLEHGDRILRSEEHTSELQSRPHLVCRLLLEKKKINL